MSATKKIKLLVNPNKGSRFIFAADPSISIQELSGELAEVIRGQANDVEGPSYEPELRVGGTKNLRKGEYYLIKADLVGDVLVEYDKVDCDIVEDTKSPAKQSKPELKSEIKADKSKRKAEEKFAEANKKTEKIAPKAKPAVDSDSESVQITVEVPKDKKPIAKKTVTEVVKEEESDPVALPKIDFGDIKKLANKVKSNIADKKDVKESKDSKDSKVRTSAVITTSLESKKKKPKQESD